MGNSDWRPFIYGGLASITAEFGTFPIDTAKTRLQVQGQQLDQQYAKLKYRGMTDVLLQISRKDGFWALYSGISPAVIRQATYGTIKFGTYYSLKNFIVEKTGQEDIVVNVGCAVAAGILASSIANPTDVVKVRMQVVHSNSLVTCLHDIYTKEGVGAFWKGVSATAYRAAVIAAVELPVYDFCKLKLIKYFGDSMANHFISSFIASLGSAVASTPIDVVRTRLMNQKHLKNQHVRVYKGSIDCMLQTIKHEGFMALYKGFIPTWVRMGPWNIIFFITYEQLKKHF
ncbi:hypothetical protein M8J77_013532 [Diaphorina citri]|nr:hypothetical protein M8J77_013532 [Diaphorina citri]